MFSEYASRFLAQSQSRLIPQDGDNPSFTDRRSASRLGSRYFPRGSNMPSPYAQTGSQLGRFAFGARNNTTAAPLFYSTTEDFREEDDGEEHEREVADFYALQRSRRTFGANRLSESSEVDDDTVENSAKAGEPPLSEQELDHPYRFERGIRSSWTGEKSVVRGRPAISASIREDREESRAQSDVSGLSKGKGRLVDVELSSSERSSVEGIEREELDLDRDDNNDPPSLQHLRQPITGTSRPAYSQNWPTRDPGSTSKLPPSRPISPDRESVPPGAAEAIAELPPETPRFDVFWSTLFWIASASLFASAFLVWLHTDTPTRKNPLGDTIYSTLHKSYHLLAVDTLVAVIVATLWLALLRSALRPLTYLLLVAVPIILFSFSLYPFITSFNGSWDGRSAQDKILRTFSFIPLVGAISWTYLCLKARHSVDRAIEILDFGTRILATSPALVFAGFASLLINIAWFWIWLAMFSRVFLEGHWVPAKSKNLFVIDISSWWLGAFYVLMLLWVQSIISGVQRATSAATVSQWYFHRMRTPTPSSRTVVYASFTHAIGTLFGTICFATFISLAIRLPLLLLPRRLVGLVSICFYSIIPSPIAALTNPLTLTYAAIHSQPLSAASQGLSAMSFITKNSPTTTLTAKTADSSHSMDGLTAYRTAKLILHATRYMMTLCLGLGGWISTARLLQIDESYRGSLYAYVVGFGAAVIGWVVLGAMEGVIGGIVDAVVVCWGSEVGAMGNGQGKARYCREAGELFEGGGLNSKSGRTRVGDV